MNYKAIDIADYFISLYKYDEEHPTNLKLNKLDYFAQGYALARFGEPLFEETIEAWDYGPVVPSIYYAFNKYEKLGIDKIEEELPKFDEAVEELLLDVARKYGIFTGSRLTSMTHEPGTPWADSYIKTAMHTEIPTDSIKKYFTESMPALPTLDEELGDLQPMEWNDAV